MATTLGKEPRFRRDFIARFRLVKNSGRNSSDAVIFGLPKFMSRYAPLGGGTAHAKKHPNFWIKKVKSAMWPEGCACLKALSGIHSVTAEISQARRVLFFLAE